MLPFLIVYGFLAVLCLAAGSLILWRIPFFPQADRPKKVCPVSVIIPARNEAVNIESLLKSLAGQSTRPTEVIVSDDGSTDGTAKTAKAYQAKVVRPGKKPKGWNGKTWACWKGAQEAKGRYLLFLDADTRLEPGGLARIMKGRQNFNGVLSAQPYHAVSAWSEKWSLFFNIVLMAGMNAFGLIKKLREPVGAFGPCLFISRKDYFALNGHRAVKGEILEDMEMGRIFKSRGIPFKLFGGKGTIHFRMYPNGFREVVEGWTKSFAVGASKTHKGALIFINFWLSGCFVAAGSLAALLIWPKPTVLIFFLILYLLYAFQIYWMAVRIGRFGLVPALLFPLYALFFVLVFIRAFYASQVNKTVVWKGKRISL